MILIPYDYGRMTVTAQDGRRFVDLPVCIATVDADMVKVWPMDEAKDTLGITEQDLRHGKFWFEIAKIEAWTKTGGDDD